VPKTALVIVHLSSLDSYTDAMGSDAGWDLARNLSDAIVDHDGPVVIVDQGWSLGLRQAEPRTWLLDQISGMKGIVWIHFDEAGEDWDPFLRKLRARLKLLDVREVVVGGIWYDPNLEEGCATEVYLYLRQFFKAKVDEDLVGCEE
jgi:hypothetical protein